MRQIHWVIIFDALFCRARAVTTPEMIETYPHIFRLLDADGNIYYYGRSRTCDDYAAFAPLEWAKADSGCTTIEYMDSYGDWEPL